MMFAIFIDFLLSQLHSSGMNELNFILFVGGLRECVCMRARYSAHCFIQQIQLEIHFQFQCTFVFAAPFECVIHAQTRDN